MKSIFTVFLFMLSIFLSVAISAEPLKKVDNSVYSELLKKYVKNGAVSYKDLKNEEKTLDIYLKTIENVDSKKLPHTERFAFYINAYNAWTIKLILGGYPEVKSIKDLGSLFSSPWKKEICRIDGSLLSLDDIEHKILRPEFRDPRVHFAIVCASKGCPPLLSKPYCGDTLDADLDLAASGFINNPEKNYFRNNTLYLSSIFKWFRADFGDDLTGFILKYATGDLKTKLAGKSGDIEIRYLDYDWSLNGE